MHEVLALREVPTHETRMSLTGKVVTEVPEHAGMKAAWVRIASGMQAWGFGLDWATAEANAVQAAEAI